MMKFFGGSSSRSYPQTGQRCMYSGPHLQLDRKYSKGVCRPPGSFLMIMNVAIWPSLVSTPNSHVLGSKRTRSAFRVHSKAPPAVAHHKSVGQPCILIGSRGSKLVPVPHEMPLKIVAMFKRHGAGYFPNCTSAGDGLQGGSSATGTSTGFSVSAATILVCPSTSGLPELCLSSMA
jgi:hypothetical protein